MSDTWIGIVVASGEITLVNLEFQVDGSPVLNDDTTWALQQGVRPEAYNVMYSRLVNYLRENSVAHIAIKGSALSRGGTKLSHLEAAELRGVVIAACASTNSEVHVVTKAHISRTFGKRKVDEYVSDESFWGDRLLDTQMRKGSREAAMLIFAVRKS